MKTGFSLLENLHRENPVLITGMGLQCNHLTIFGTIEVACLAALQKNLKFCLSNAQREPPPAR